MKRVLVQAQKEWAEFRRDRLSLSLAFLLPLVTLLLFGFGVRMQSHDIPVVIRDNNHSQLSLALMDRLSATNLLHPIQWPADKDVAEAVDKGEAKAAIIIPKDFEQKILSGQEAVVETMVDGTDIVNSRMIEATIQGAGMYLMQSVGLDKPLVKVKPNLRVWFNPGMKESLFIVPGVCGIVLWMFPSLLACVATAREKEQGTLVQVFMSSMSAHEMILGKSLVYLLIGLAQAAVVVVLACVLFNLKFVGSPLIFMATLPVFVLNSVLFGLAVGSWANSQTTAVQGVSSLGFFTCFLLSGFVYPLANIPYPLNLLSYLVPSRYFIEVSRDAFERGLGGVNILLDFVALVLFSMLFFFIEWSAWRRMQFKV